MFQLLKNIYNRFTDYDHQKELYARKFEEENQLFDDELNKEKVVVEEKAIDVESTTEEEQKCSRRYGVITLLQDNMGFIDHTVAFNASVIHNFNELKKGSKVEYTSYYGLTADDWKVVKVELVEEALWEEAISDAEIQKTIQRLKSDGTKYFNTHQRSVLGLIVSRNRQFLTVDTDYQEISVDLDVVKIDFIPKEGDRIYLNCNVQTDENFADLAGEILEVTSVYPARKKTDEGRISKINDDWGVVNDDIYFTLDTIDDSVTINVGDVINAEMIECERGNFFWRCLTIQVLERKVNPLKPPNVIKNKMFERKKNGIQAITMTDDIRFVFEKSFEIQEQKIEMTNNSERAQQLTAIKFIGMSRNSQLRFSENNFPIIIDVGKTVNVTLICESRFFGLTREKICFFFNQFKIYRIIEISVGVDEDIEDAENRSKKIRAKRPRGYANQVWDKKKTQDVIPGVRQFTSRRFVANRIGSFDVPDKLRNVLLMDCSLAEQIGSIGSLYPCVTKELDFKNYVARFQLLLHVEEIEHFVNFRQYDREKAHFDREGEYMSLFINNLAERRPSLVMGDSVVATDPWDKTARVYEGIIHKILFDRILIKFNQEFHSSYNGMDYRLEFYFSRFGFRKQHYAIRKIVQRVSENFLFPTQFVLSEKLQLKADLNEDDNLLINQKLAPKQWCNPNLNKVQKTAIKNILRGEARSMPYIIFGPPGTGKTVTIVETILQLILNISGSRIVVATPSNSAADLIATRLINSGILFPGDVVRLVSQRVIDKDIIPTHLKPYCATADIAAEGSAKDEMITTEGGIKLRCQMKYLGRHKITIGTCSTLGLLLQMNFPRNHFTHVIIDESGQCTEPELMVPISLLSPYSGQVILAGDPCQLGPVIVNNFAGNCGLRMSFLERIVQSFPYRKDKIRFPDTGGSDPRLVTKLIYNYRALPSILESYNSLFYDSELIPMLKPKGNREFDILDSIRILLPLSDTRSESHGIFFHGIRGENKQDTDSPSWYNPIEARQVFLTVIKMFELKITPNQIGIITPYQKQVKILRSLFIEANLSMPKIGSVEEFQGQERDIIIISTVRSSKSFIDIDLKFALGFACNPKRMNVAISRARAMLYICGNPHLLALTDKWRELIQYCVDNDAYIGCDLPDTLTMP